MDAAYNIGNFSSYEICRRFRVCLPSLANYLVRTLGIDRLVKSEPERKIKQGKFKSGSRLRRRVSMRLHAHRKHRKKRRTSKKTRHEYVESI